MYDGGKKTSNFKYKIKRLNDLNSKFMKDILQKTRWLTRNLSNIKVHFHNTVGYDDKSFTTLGPRIWNSSPETDFSNLKST